VRRLPVAAFVALVIATVAAFFVTQHLKVTTPLLQGSPAPVPAAFNPVSGRVCKVRNPLGERVPTSFRRMRISFYLQHRADDVDVYIVDQDGAIVDTLASGRHMAIDHRVEFTWDGRRDDGSVASDGTYYVRVSLIHQGRTFTISNSAGPETVTIETRAPALAVTSVRPALIPQASGAAVVARFTGGGGRRPQVVIYRTDLPGGAVVVKRYDATNRHRTLWNGTLSGGRPAPQGTYLVGLQLTDPACNVARFPASLPPTPGSTAHAGVTVRYLAAQPPLTAVPAGHTATVDVDARRQRYTWTLRAAGGRRTLRSGSTAAVALRVALPGSGPGLYELSLGWGPHRTTIPLVASARAGRPRVLVVLPALTWQGRNPVDDNGDGIPNTLTAGEPIRLSRPLVDGLPSGFADEAALVAHLQRSGLRFDLTTDIALTEATAATLRGRTGVVLAGDEPWLPGALGASLREFVQGGGHVLELGIDSLRRTVTVSDGEARDPSPPAASDALLARPGPIASTHGALIFVDRDRLRIFTQTSGALRGYGTDQPVLGVDPPAAIVSAAGTTPGRPAIVGYRLGRGSVVDIGLPGFAGTLARNVDAAELLGSVWSLLSR